MPPSVQARKCRSRICTKLSARFGSPVSLAHRIEYRIDLFGRLLKVGIVELADGRDFP